MMSASSPTPHVYLSLAGLVTGGSGPIGSGTAICLGDPQTPPLGVLASTSSLNFAQVLWICGTKNLLARSHWSLRGCDRAHCTTLVSASLFSGYQFERKIESDSPNTSSASNRGAERRIESQIRTYRVRIFQEVVPVACVSYIQLRLPKMIKLWMQLCKDL